jgi:septal ring factor EnvC (AmiA/AmiB activator)
MSTSPSEDLQFVEAELARREQKAKKAVQTTKQIHHQMVVNYKQTQEEISRLKAKREAIDRQIEALERKQENRKKFNEQVKKNS